MPARTSLIVPGLFDLPRAELDARFARAQLPGVNRIVGLGTPIPNRAFDIDAMVARALALGDANPATKLPLAQAQPGADDEPTRALLCEAIHLRPDLRSAVVVPIDKTPENLSEINIIINDLKELFKADCDISALPGGRYLMRLNAVTAPRHYPHVLSVLGKSASPYIEQSRENLPWYRLLNEMQMFLHQHRINAERLAAGRLPINSLWFWGGGPAPADPGVAAAWFGDDAELGRFAESLGLGTQPLEAFASAAAGDAVVVDLRLLETLKSVRGGALDRPLLELEQQVVAPALARLAQRGNRVRLYAGFDVDFELGPYAHLRFWRRSRSLLDWIPGDGAD